MLSFWLINMSAVFALSVIIGRIVIPQIQYIAFRKRLFDVPDERKIHRNIVPRLGGVSFVPVMFFSLLLVYGVDMSLGFYELYDAVCGEALPLSFGCCAVIALYLVGIEDDLVGLKYRFKFFIQVMCALMLVAGGVWLADLHGVLWLHGLSPWAGIPLTVLVSVFIINAINLIDGIDGLASGLCAIAFLLCAVYFFILGEYIYAMVSVSMLGVLLPFIYYNVFGNAERGRKIFMGDAGSLSIGIILCFLCCRLAMCAPEGKGMPNPLILAFSPMIVPCFDVVRVYLHRIRNRKNPFLPDRNHIHHKLLSLGMGQRDVRIVIIASSITLTVLNSLLSIWVNPNIILAGDIILYTVINIWITKRINR